MILDETYEFKFTHTVKKKLEDYLILNFKEDHASHN